MERPLTQQEKEALAELLASAMWNDARRAEAKGWLVVVVDSELHEPVSSAYGPVDTPEEAVVLAGQMDTQSSYDNEPPWRHVIVPLFNP